MITNNVIGRTFFLRINDEGGTCFTIDIDGRQYIITAKHLLAKKAETACAYIYHANDWRDAKLHVVGHAPNGIDISVLASDFRLSGDLPLPADSDGLTYGQDVYFLGFPYGWHVDPGSITNDYPLPFVKKAIVSSIFRDSAGRHIIYLDGHNNHGFSGGPVVFQNGARDFQVAAVIAGYNYVKEPIYYDSTPLCSESQKTFFYKYNTGIVVTYGIKHAVEIIKQNPIGLKL